MRRPGLGKADDPDRADPNAARRAALQLLARRDFSSHELSSKLVDRGFDPALIGDLIAALQRERLLDDTRYVEHFVSYHAARGQGPFRIGRELRACKVDPELIERLVEQGQDWAARAREARQKKFGRAVPADYAGKAKQARFLQYRGFSGAHIRAALGTDIDVDDDSSDNDEPT